MSELIFRVRLAYRWARMPVMWWLRGCFDRQASRVALGNALRVLLTGRPRKGVTLNPNEGPEA